MLTELLLFLGSSGVLLVAAMLVYRTGRTQLPEEVMQRLVANTASAAEGERLQRTHRHHQSSWALSDYVRAWLRRAGIEAPATFLTIAGLADLGVLLAVALETHAWLGFVVALLFVPFVLWVVLLSRASKRRTQILLAMPNFLDGLVRVTRVGASLPAAILAVTKESHGPIQALFLQVVSRQQAGLSLEDGLHAVGQLYEIEELSLISAVLRLNLRYGGRTDLVLERIAEWMRTRVAAQAEFNALSAETRLSALLLSALIPGIAVFIVLYNYAYMATMWLDPAGRLILIGAFALLVSGIFILMRMSKLGR